MFLGTICWEKRTKPQNTKTAKYMLQSKVEYVLVYKNKKERYDFNLFEIGEREYPSVDENGQNYRLEQIGEMSAAGMRGRNTMIFEIEGVLPKEGNQWKFGVDTVNKFKERNDLIIKNRKAYFRIRAEDETVKTLPFWGLKTKDVGTAENGKDELSKILGSKEHDFETVKPVRLVYELLFHVIGNKKDSIVLDFFAGDCVIIMIDAIDVVKSRFLGNKKFSSCLA